MGLFNAIAVSSTALEAQSVRLNTISSNLANADVVSGSAEGVYQARYPVFSTVMSNVQGAAGEGVAGVKVDGIVESSLPARQEYSPSHPLADENGYIYRSNVNSVDEMANMMSASRSYQGNIEVMNTTKQLIIRTLTLGR